MDDLKKQLALIEYFSSIVTEKRLSKIKKVLDQRTDHFTIVLEDLYQSLNVGAIMRTCESFGIQDIHCIEKRNKIEVNKNLSMGSSKWLSIKRFQLKNDCDPVKNCVDNLIDRGYQIIVTSPHATDRLSDLDLTKKTALVFGTEETGISDQMASYAHKTVSIDMFGFTESFNVSVSVAIIFSQLLNKIRSNPKIDFGLDPIYKNELLLSWLKISVPSPDILQREFLKKLIL